MSYDIISGAPFPFKAIWSKLWETLGEFYGIESIIREMQKKGTGAATHWAAEALGNLKNPDAVDPLIAALNARDKTLNEEAARALGKIGDPRAVEALIVLLKRNYNYQEGSRKDYDKIKCAVIEALGNIGDPRAVEPLIWYLPSAPPSGYYRVGMPNKKEQFAKTALIKITGVSIYYWDKFSTRERAQEWWEQNNTTWALGNMIASSIEELKDYQTWTDVNELVSIGEPAVKPLVEALSHKSRQIRSEASIVLSKMGSIAVDPLLAILKDESSSHNNRGNAGLILGEIGDPRAVEPLIEALKDKDFPRRGHIARALEGFRDPRVVEPLIEALKDKDFPGRGDIVRALGRFRDPRVAEQLIEALKDKDFPSRDYVIVKELTRNYSILDLREIGNRWVVKLLIDVLKDESSRYRGEAGVMLGKIGDPRAFEPLVAALKDKDWLVRNSIVNALGWMKDPRAIAPLIDMLDDLLIYPVVCSMLTKITGIDFGQSKEKWRKWWKKNKKKYIKRETK